MELHELHFSNRRPALKLIGQTRECAIQKYLASSPSLPYAHLTRSKFVGTFPHDLFMATDCDFSHANIAESKLENVFAAGSIFDGADLGSSQFIDCSFKACSFNRTDFSSTQWKRCDLADIEGTAPTFYYSSFEDCTFSGAEINNASFILCRFKNCNFKAARFENSYFTGADFRECQVDTETFFINCFSLCMRVQGSTAKPTVNGFMLGKDQYAREGAQ